MGRVVSVVAARRRRAGGAAGRGGRARAGRGDARRPALRGRRAARRDGRRAGDRRGAAARADDPALPRERARPGGLPRLPRRRRGRSGPGRGRGRAAAPRRAARRRAARRRVRPRAVARGIDARARVQVAGRVQSGARRAAAAAHGAARGVAVRAHAVPRLGRARVRAARRLLRGARRRGRLCVSTKALGKSVRKKTGLDAIFNASAAPPGAAPVAESAYLNAGVLAFRNSTGARRLLAAWRRVFVDEYPPARRALDAGPAGAVVGRAHDARRRARAAARRVPLQDAHDRRDVRAAQTARRRRRRARARRAARGDIRATPAGGASCSTDTGRRRGAARRGRRRRARAPRNFAPTPVSVRHCDVGIREKRRRGTPEPSTEES